MNSTAKGAVAPLSVSLPWGLGGTWGGDFRHDRQQRLDKAYMGPWVGGSPCHMSNICNANVACLCH